MAVALAAAAVSPATVSAWPIPAGDVPDQVIRYPAPGLTAAVVGDVNGDGLDDIAAASGYDGRGYVTFSRRDGGTIDATGPGGFAIDTHQGWRAVAGVGDVDGDGLSDVAVISYDTLYVIFGKRDDATVDSASLGARGFTVTGAGGGWNSAAVARLGDLNGDGRGDFAVGTPHGASLVYPPAGVAGSTIDAAVADGPVAHIDAPVTNVSVGDLGDLDGDHRDDVLVGGAGSSGSSLVYGVAAPGPGGVIDADDAVARHLAFRLAVPSAQAAGVQEAPVGDENGDGRDEVVLTDLASTVVYSPPFGTAANVGPFGANDVSGRTFQSLFGPAVGVGDQSGDGGADFAVGDTLYFAPAPGDIGGPPLANLGLTFRGMIIGPVADLNGDGIAEIAARNSNDGSVVVYDSLPAPQVGVPAPAAINPTGSLSTAVDVTTGVGRRRSPAARAALTVWIEIASPGGPAMSLSAANRTTSEPIEHVSIRIRPRTPDETTLTPGEEYRFRIRVRSQRLLEGYSEWQPFVYEKEPARPGSGGRSALAIVLRGTRKKDRLRGSAKDERLFGLAGNDYLDGRGGNDFIDGGAGNDSLIGGPGDDDLVGGGGKDRFAAGPGNDWINSYDGKAETVDCGSGRDTVVADKKDRLRHCEKAKRRR